MIQPNLLTRSTTALLAVAALAIVPACDVQKTQEGEAPKVNVEGGQLPKYDVTTPDVKVGSKETTVTVPTVDVTTGSEKREAAEGAPAAPAPAPANP